MAKVVTLSPEDQAKYDAWFAEQPPAMQDLLCRLDPTRLYRMKSSGHRRFIFSMYETPDGIRLTVVVSGQFNRVTFDRRVFGIEPDDLVECDLPGPDEALGAMLTSHEDIAAFIETVRSAEQEKVKH